jgi:HAMP domain-containing protein
MEKARITLGADPEFELILDGEVVAVDRAEIASKVLVLPWGVIGVDKSGDPIELRPRPSADPEALVGNVGRLLLSVPRALGGFPSTISEEYPLGGHVHIGGVPSEDQEELVEVIDGLLGDLFYALSAELRLNRGYGRRGDWQEKRWGFEYRTPPASVWSHPGVALTFVRAIKWVTEKFLSGEDLFEDPAWPAVRAGAEKATEFVRKHGGRLHWGAWKEHIGRVDLRGKVKVKVFPDGSWIECDNSLFDDLRAMFARLGIPSVWVLPFLHSKGDYISSVPGYGEVVRERHLLYRPGGFLSLSWRFRNDPEFRRAEMGKLEAAIARLVEEIEEIGERDGGRLVREAAPFGVEGPHTGGYSYRS